jgi:aryl-alcohol dehydrogenase-like predicted oxidoreductase
MVQSVTLRPLGHSGLMVPKLTFGGNVLGWTADRAMSFRLLDACLDAGLNAIDTADAYSFWVPGGKGGESETIIGEWLKARGNRDRVLIFTKVGHKFGDMPGGLSPQTIERGVEASLKRLGIDCIDLYMAHYDDPATPQDEAMGAFAALVKAGKVRALGASNFTAERLASAQKASAELGLPRFESLQTHYNLMERPAFEGALEDFCTASHLGVMSYFSLARGFLSGKYRAAADSGQSPRGGSVLDYLGSAKGQAVLKALDRVAAELDSNPAQISLAWLMARPSVTTAIASATKPEQLVDLIKSTQLVLPAWAIEQLNAASVE